MIFDIFMILMVGTLAYYFGKQNSIIEMNQDKKKKGKNEYHQLDHEQGGQLIENDEEKAENKHQKEVSVLQQKLSDSKKNKDRILQQIGEFKTRERKYQMEISYLQTQQGQNSSKQITPQGLDEIVSKAIDPETEQINQAISESIN